MKFYLGCFRGHKAIDENTPRTLFSEEPLYEDGTENDYPFECIGSDEIFTRKDIFIDKEVWIVDFNGKDVGKDLK